MNLTVVPMTDIGHGVLDNHEVSAPLVDRTPLAGAKYAGQSLNRNIN